MNHFSTTLMDAFRSCHAFGFLLWPVISLQGLGLLRLMFALTGSDLAGDH